MTAVGFWVWGIRVLLSRMIVFRGECFGFRLFGLGFRDHWD